MMNSNLLIALLFLISYQVNVINGIKCEKLNCEEIKIKKIYPLAVVTSSQPEITIEGENLNKISHEDVFNISIGDTKCEIELLNVTISCVYRAPQDPQSNSLIIKLKPNIKIYGNKVVQVSHVKVKSSEQNIYDNYMEVFVRGNNLNIGKERQLLIGDTACTIIDAWSKNLIQCYFNKIDNLDIKPLVLEIDRKLIYLGPIKLHKLNKTSSFQNRENKMITFIPVKSTEIPTVQRKQRPVFKESEKEIIKKQYSIFTLQIPEKIDNSRDIYYLAASVCLGLGIFGTFIMLILYLIEKHTEIEIDIPEDVS